MPYKIHQRDTLQVNSAFHRLSSNARQHFLKTIELDLLLKVGRSVMQERQFGARSLTA